MENQYSYYNPEGQQNNGYYNNQPEDPDQHNKKRNGKIKIPKTVTVIGFAVIFGVVASGVFLTTSVVGGKALGLKSTTTTVKNTTPVSSLNQGTSVVTSDVSGVVENVMPSIVSITNMSVNQVQDYFGGVAQQQSESAGTGIIISQNDTELLIVTNNHVVEGSDTLTVTFADNTSVEANMKGTDANHDVAVISVPVKSLSDDTMNAISVATLGDSTKLKVGEPAIAIGNALGYGQSVTTGVISATDRESTTTDQTTGQTTTSDVKLIQTDAAINPGNSGGALLNASGEVIGINSSKLVGSTVEGVGYAIPISDVSDIIQNLMTQETKEKVSEGDRGYLGVTIVDVTSDSSQRYNMPVGVYINDVNSGGAADKAGIVKGSVITGLNGTTIDSMSTLQKELEYYAKGDKVSITIQVADNSGNWTEKTVDVTLGSKS